MDGNRPTAAVAGTGLGKSPSGAPSKTTQMNNNYLLSRPNGGRGAPRLVSSAIKKSDPDFLKEEESTTSSGTSNAPPVLTSINSSGDSPTKSTPPSNPPSDDIKGPEAPTELSEGVSDQLEADPQELEMLKEKLGECPSWLLVKLRDEMRRRKHVEQQWILNSQKMNQYMEQLSKWKQSVTKQLEQQKSKGYELMTELQQSISDELQALRQELKEKNELIKQKDAQIQERDNELKWKREDIKRLTLLVTSSGSASSTSNAHTSHSHHSQEHKHSSVPLEMTTSSDSFLVTTPVEEDSYSLADWRASWLDPKARADQVVELLFKNGFAVLETILEHTIRVSDEFISSLLHIAEARNETMRLFHFAIQQEVESTKSEATLFRGNSITTKMMTMYTTFYGVNFLSEVLQPLLVNIISENLSYEVDPNRNETGEDLTVNMARLAALAQSFVDRILEYSKFLPDQFKQICVMLTSEITKKFPEELTAGVKNFIFLRYICPAILAPPKEFGIEDIPANPRRTMVLISKILQNCVNGVELKEPFMLSLNEFVGKNSQRLKEFMIEVGKQTSEPGQLSPLRAKATGADHAVIVVNGLIAVREQVLDKLRQTVEVPISTYLVYRVSARFLTVCSLWGPYKKGTKINFSLSEPRTNELVLLMLEEEQFLVDLIKLLCQDKDADKLISIVVYVIMNKNPKAFTKLIQTFLHNDILGSGSVDVASKKLLVQLAVFITQEHVKNAFGSLLDDLALLPDELKANSEQLYDYCYRVIISTVNYLSFVPQPIGSILRYLHQNLLDRFGQNMILVTLETMDFWMCVICEALLNPELFNLNPKTSTSETARRRMKKSLATLSETIPKFLRSSDEIPVEYRNKVRPEDPRALFVAWASGTEEGTTGLVYSNKLTLKEALRSLYTILNDKSPSVVQRLGENSNSRQVELNLADFLDCLLKKDK